VRFSYKALRFDMLLPLFDAVISAEPE